MSSQSLRTPRAFARFDFAILAALVACAMLLMLPDSPQQFGEFSWLRIPVELPFISLVLVLLRGPLQRLACVVGVTLLAALTLLRLGDIGAEAAFGRRFSPLVDWQLFGDGWQVVTDTVGKTEALVAVAISLLALLVICVVVYIGFSRLARLSTSVRMKFALYSAAVFVVGASLQIFASPEQKNQVFSASVLPELSSRIQRMQDEVVYQAKFAIELQQDPFDTSHVVGGPILSSGVHTKTPSVSTLKPGIVGNLVGRAAPAATVDKRPDFAALQGRDVLVLFVESYGRTFLADEEFSDAAQSRLEKFNDTLTQNGLGARSSWVTSPIRGGRSWLAHATFMSGLDVGNHARFQKLVTSERVSLNRLFSAAGWKTVAVMPSVIKEWPTSIWYGYDEIYNAERMAYAGEDFGWVTMPDQYTLSAFENNIRQPSERPLMAEFGLISSHAPWTPLPFKADWETVGDGAVFDGSQRSGEAASTVWQDRDKIRAQYAKSLDYSLDIISEYLARHADDALVIIVGDHQPASVIAGWAATSDVPVHIIANSKALLDRLPEDQFIEGMVPDKEGVSMHMGSMREMLGSRFNSLPVKSPSAEPL